MSDPTLATLLAEMKKVGKSVSEQTKSIKEEVTSQITRVEQTFKREVETLRSHQQETNNSMAEIGNRVRILETNGGAKDKLLDEIYASNKKIYIKSRDQMDQFAFQEKIDLVCRNVQLAGWTVIPQRQEWYQYVATFLSTEDREKTIFDGQQSIERGGRIKIKRDVPVSFKNAVRSLEDKGAAFKKALAGGNGENTLSTKVVFEGAMAVLKFKERRMGARWETIEQKGPDEVLAGHPGGIQGIADLGKTAVLHGRYQESQLREHITAILGVQWEALRVLRMEPGKNCMKIQCQTASAASRIAEGLNGKTIPGSNNRFSCFHIPAAPGRPEPMDD